MLRSLKEPLDLLDLARQGAEIEAIIPLSQFKRAAGLLRDEGQNVAVRLGFFPGEGIVLIDGSLQAELVAVCQRCLEPARLTLDGPFELAICADPSVGAGAVAGRDLVVLAELEDQPRDLHGVSLHSLVEDEILLRLPLVPMHESRDQCGELARLAGDDEGEVTEMQKTSPFSQLADLVTNPKRKN
jgi:uncharacterized protein